MKTQLFTKGLLAVTMISMVGATSAFAGPVIPLHRQPQPQTRLRPLVPPPVVLPSPSTPRLGFMGHVQYGYGMVVDSVSRGTFASRVGLERGDVIVRINNRSINSDRAYSESLWSAVRFQNGFVDMVVVDVRTGQTRHRTGFINGMGNGPSLPRSAPHMHVSMGSSF